MKNIVRKHTPTPWKHEIMNNGYAVLNERGDVISTRLSEDDSAFIVRAINTHDKLLSLLKMCYHHMEDADNRKDILNVIAEAEAE